MLNRLYLYNLQRYTKISIYKKVIWFLNYYFIIINMYNNLVWHGSITSITNGSKVSNVLVVHVWLVAWRAVSSEYEIEICFSFAVILCNNTVFYWSRVIIICVKSNWQIKMWWINNIKQLQRSSILSTTGKFLNFETI